MFLKKCLIFVVIILGFVVIAQANQTFIIDPIGDHSNGDKFNITGSTTIENCKKIGIEIFPEKYWDDTSAFAKINNTGKVKFRELAATTENIHPPGINLVRYNSDGTQSYQTFDICKDHLNSVVPVQKGQNGELHWTADIYKNDNGTPFAPGKYHVNIWDASNQVDHPGAIMPNGWNILNQTIYPSTALVNVWDPKNQKEMEYAQFTITGK
jgi:hypothetical protein